MSPYKLLDLFSGIGGFSLGLERSGGFKTVAFCEIEEFPRKVLRKHWPEVPIYEDVRTLTAERLAADGIAVDAICGGFPCQDISSAGKGAGIDGERSGLWSEYARIIGELRPAYVIVENVAALLGRGLDRVLGDLAAIGYDAEWHCIPAAAVGAPHRRDRIWIVAHANPAERWPVCGSCDGLALGAHGLSQWQKGSGRFVGGGEALAHASGERRGEARQLRRDEPEERLAGRREEMADTRRLDAQGQFARSFDPQVWRRSIQRQIGSCSHGLGWWATEPGLGRVAHGVPSRVDRLKGLGNAVVPQIPELIGRAIIAAEAA